MTVEAAPLNRINWRSGATYGALVLATLITVLPFLVMVLVSLKPGQSALGDLFNFGGWSFDSYARVLGTSNVGVWTLNSLLYSGISVILVLLFGAMAGYAFAKKRFFGREAIFWTFLAMLMVPTQVTLIPLFIFLSKLGGLNTMWGLIVPTIANAQAVFLMRQFIAGIPDELIEAAKLDGASEWRIFWQIVLPHTGPIMATMGTFVFVWHWNDFLWPLLIAQNESTRTLTVGLATLQTQMVDTSVIMAGTALSFIPTFVVFLVLQRYFVQSVMTSGLK